MSKDRKETKKEKAVRAKKNRVHVMLVPHGGGSNRVFPVHTVVVVLLVLGSVTMLAYAAFVVSGYWRTIIDYSHLSTLEERDTAEEHKLEVLEKGVVNLEGKVAEIDSQHESLVEGHRLDEIRQPSELLPADYVTGDTELSSIEARIKRTERNLGLVRRHFGADPDGVATIPSVIPCQGWFYRDFGNTVSPFTGRVEMHTGLDIVAPRGTPIIAAASGIVTVSGLEEHWGLTVEIGHGNGYVTRYCHNMRNAVPVGTKVARGTVIAYVGSTGRSSCTHVHYEVRKDGVPANPRYFILKEPSFRAVKDKPKKEVS